MAKRVKHIPNLTREERRAKNGKGRPTYRPSKTLDFRLTEPQKAEAIKLFNMAKNVLVNSTLDVDISSRDVYAMAGNILGNIEFDIDAGSRPLENAVHKSNMRGGIQKYLKFLS